MIQKSRSLLLLQKMMRQVFYKKNCKNERLKKICQNCEDSMKCSQQILFGVLANVSFHQSASG